MISGADDEPEFAVRDRQGAATSQGLSWLGRPGFDLG